MDMKKIGLFAAGVLFGTAGIKVLSSKDAKKAYAQTTAAALRAKDSVMTAVTAVREGADDVYAEASIAARRVFSSSGAWERITVSPLEWEEETFSTENAARTVSLMWASHMEQAMPKT